VRKKVIIGALALLLLGGAGGGAYVFLFKAPDAAVEAAAPPPPDPAYVKVATLIAPVVRDGRLEKYLALGLVIEAKDTSTASEIEGKMPRLRDAFLRDLSSNVIEIQPDNTVDMEALRARLVHQATGVMGDGHVKTVLISSVLPIRG
jgi:flagellar basal body-associated protein FliL